MLVTPGNGIMLLASMTFLAIGLVGWLSFPKRDRSAMLWMLAFTTSGLAPLIAAVMTEPGSFLGFVSSACIFAVSFFLFGLSLRALHQPGFLLKEYSLIAAAVLLIYALLLGFIVTTGSVASQIIMFALGNGLAAAWATQQAMLLSERQPSSFASHLVIIFGLQTAILLMRIPQVIQGDERRLWDAGTTNELILVVLCLLGIVKAISYFALRYEEVRQKLSEESEIIRTQAAQLARKNADIAAAMHIVPVACVVTRPSLEVLYLNAEARRIFGNPVRSKMKISELTVGLQDQSNIALASARHMFIRNLQQPVVLTMQVIVNELDSESSAAQRVFTFKPAACTRDIIESIWMFIPRVEHRTWLVGDRNGIIISAQSGWGEVLGHCGTFHTPELHFGGMSYPHDAQGMDLWASLHKFSQPNNNQNASQILRARQAVHAGSATSLMIRDQAGSKLSCGLTPIHDEGVDEPLWLIEVSLKMAPASYKTRKKTLAEQTTAAILAAPSSGGANEHNLAGVRFDR